MPEPVVAIAAFGAGGLGAAAVIAVGYESLRIDLRAPERGQRLVLIGSHIATAQGLLALRLQQAGWHWTRERVGIVRLDRQGTIVAGECVIEALQGPQRHATVIECFGIVGLNHQCTVIAGKCLVKTLQVAQHIAAAVEAF